MPASVGPEHVAKYHEWMTDPDLLEATDSEPLSMEEEVEMQQSWRDDPNKCTFIVHATSSCKYDIDTYELHGFSVKENLSGMVGDVNLFLSEIDDEEDENGTEVAVSDKSHREQAEIDIMIAERDYKKQGLGRAATSSMLLFGANRLGIERFFCKINEDNTASINLFNSLGFVQCNYAECFKQVELELKMPANDDLQRKLEGHGSYREAHCPIDDYVC